MSNRFATRKEIRHRREFAAAANAILFNQNAKAVKPSKPKIKSDAQKLRDTVEIIKGLARAYLKTDMPTLEKGREVYLTGKIDTGLAIRTCAALLKLDAAGAGEIRLINGAEGAFSKAEETAINDVIKTISPRSPVKKVKPIINETQAAKITREVHKQAAHDFFLSPEQARILGQLDKPATPKKTKKGPTT